MAGQENTNVTALDPSSPHLNRRRLGRRRVLLSSLALALSATLSKHSFAKTYMDADTARRSIWGDMVFTPTPVTLSREQMKQIKKASKVRVRASKINGFQSADGHWFILDQVIGKHENIDIAVGIDRNGKIKGIEILEYRESYGHEIINPKWMAQFLGQDASQRYKLDHQVQNIAGATLSCRHITDGMNRLTQTWELVLQTA